MAFYYMIDSNLFNYSFNGGHLGFFLIILYYKQGYKEYQCMNFHLIF